MVCSQTSWFINAFCVLFINKIDVLDDGDILKIAFISGTDDSDVHYSDMFYTEEVEKRLFQSSVSETENEVR